MLFIWILVSDYRKLTLFGIAVIVFVTAIFLMNNSGLSRKISQIEFEENTVYLVLRGTDTKIGGIVKKYNLYNGHPSHVGIAVLENQQLKIFHVNENLSERGDNLFYEPIQNFISKDDITYLSIWKVTGIDSLSYKRIYDNLLKSLKQKYVFDKKIELNNNRYYCSEYVVKMIDCLECLNFEINKQAMNGLARRYLKRDTLIYYPVDGFIQSRNVKRIFEWKKN